jgi:hypothetical protein
VYCVFFYCSTFHFTVGCVGRLNVTFRDMRISLCFVLPLCILIAYINILLSSTVSYTGTNLKRFEKTTCMSSAFTGAG